MVGTMIRSGLTIAVITHDRTIAGQLPRRLEILDGRLVTGTCLEPAGMDLEPLDAQS